MQKNWSAAAYAVCMILGVSMILYALFEALPPRPVRQVSIYPASTVSPLMGFAEDSVFNIGSADQLDAFPRIGDVLSNRIVEGREVFGGYRLPEDLLLVKGIGPKTLSGILDVLTEPLVQLPPVSE